MSITPSEQFEHYCREAISSSPQPLQDLGKFLADVLDEDHWKTAESYLLALAINSADLLEALKGLLAMNCPIVGPPFRQAVVDHWRAESEAGNEAAHLYLAAHEAVAKAEGRS